MQQAFSLFRKRWGISILLGLIILFYFFNGIHYLRSQSITSDEASFMDYTIRFLKGQPDRTHPRTDNSKMPVIVLNTLPRVAQDIINPGQEKTDGGASDILNGRYVTLIVSAFSILLVFGWSRELYGEKAGLFSAFLFSVCPNNLANAGLVTTDSYAVFFLLLGMYLLWKFCLVKSNRYFILFSLVVALSQLVKQSLFHFYVLAPLCLLTYYLVNRHPFRWRIFTKRLLIFLVINFVIINAGYYFHQSFRAAGDYTFMSSLFQALQSVFPASFPIPFPVPFTEGLDMAKYYDQVGGGIDKLSSFGKVTILGRARTGDGFWYYYFVSLFYKTPIAYLIFIGWGLISLFRKTNLLGFFSREFFLLAPVIYFLVLMSFFYQTQCGIRHIIFIFPFLFIFSGILIRHLSGAATKIICGLICLYLLLSVLRYWGNYFPYTNEFILDKKMAYAKVGTANLEFQQGYFFAQDYMKDHPDVQWAPKQATSGKFIISTEDYLDIWNRKEFEWISRYPPSGHVAYNYLLIDTGEKIGTKPGP